MKAETLENKTVYSVMLQCGFLSPASIEIKTKTLIDFSGREAGPKEEMNKKNMFFY